MLNKKYSVNNLWLISIYYREYGPFTMEELAERAKKREFGWDMYVYRLPKDNVWRPARDIPETREILLNNFPLQHGDMGPAGGYVFKLKDKTGLYELSPADAGYCPWENAENICKHFSFNGFNDWRFPSLKELSASAAFINAQIREERSVEHANENIFHWSNERKNQTAATAVITCIDKNKKNDLVIGRDTSLPVKEWHHVRPVRDLTKTPPL